MKHSEYFLVLYQSCLLVGLNLGLLESIWKKNYTCNQFSWEICDLFTSTFCEDTQSDCFLNCEQKIPRILRILLLVAITGKIISKITRSNPNYYPQTFPAFSAALLNDFLWHISPICCQGSKYKYLIQISHMNVKFVVKKMKEYSLVIKPQRIMKTFNCGAMLFLNQNWHWPAESVCVNAVL